MKVHHLQEALSQMIKQANNDTTRQRANWMNAQLTAFGRRIKIFSGESTDFDSESRELYGVVAPVFPESHYQALVAQLDALLPGKGAITKGFRCWPTGLLFQKTNWIPFFALLLQNAEREQCNITPCPLMKISSWNM
jgi:hypothetical protein